MYILLGEHVMAYMFNIFRNYDINKNGYIWKGIEIADCEFRLRILEFLVDFIIILIILIHFIKGGKDQFNDVPMLNFFILVDLIIMLLSLPYANIVELILQNQEIEKNIFTLF